VARADRQRFNRLRRVHSGFETPAERFADALRRSVESATVRRELRRNGGRRVYRSPVTDSSYGGRWIPASSYLASSQPVYYSYAAVPKRLRAIVVRFSDSKELTFVFDVPSRKNLKFDAWSSWYRASGVTENQRVEGMILRGMSYERTEPPESGPLIRYRIMQFNDFLKTVRKKTDPPELLEGSRCTVSQQR
jgi:hypothetical protein